MARARCAAHGNKEHAHEGTARDLRGPRALSHLGHGFVADARQQLPDLSARRRLQRGRGDVDRADEQQQLARDVRPVRRRERPHRLLQDARDQKRLQGRAAARTADAALHADGVHRRARGGRDGAAHRYRADLRQHVRPLHRRRCELHRGYHRPAVALHAHRDRQQVSA